ncbi:hypothetical protein CANARDRAFT_7881 [[Candida] arabinofermentans NRRL YB-2248]|uniref:Uncharacterized protein n=1 Tax=[Candida] arabinofermentans NRRL YB-2248 TaxID=983967 RepID=A0A1E4T0D7_9ASCO|nr:hypothetical protein CANARDRAFT_7881 [[Candida] arabinofermentans NRRL YB-2248]
MNRLMDLAKRKCTNKNSQYCETGSDISTVSIVLAVVIPTIVVACAIGLFAYRAYRRNKKESLEDDDPDFNGDNTILPDYPPNNYHHDDKSMMMLDENPFESSKNDLRYPSRVIDDFAKGPNNNTNVRAMSQVNMESFVLPFAEDTRSKTSLEQLSRHLGGVYPGYKISNNESKTSLSSRRSSSSHQSKPLTGYEKSLETTEDSADPKFDHVTTTKNVTDESTNEVTQTNDEASQHEIELEENSPFGDEASFDHDRSGASVLYTGEKEQQKQEKSRIETEDDININKDEYGVTPEEEEQINRMKSVYKVYFSRENSLKSKKSNNDMTADYENLPPLPQMPQQIATAPESIRQQSQQQNGQPVLQIDTNPRDSYASSVYVENQPINQQQPFYPHQHIQNMMNYQQQQQQQQLQLQQQYRYQQQQARPKRRPSELKRLENLPSPHEFHNRNSVLETFTDFEHQRKYQNHSSNAHHIPTPPIHQQQNFSPLDHTQWGASKTSDSKPSPHQIRDSIVMYNPVDINYNTTYKPKGTLSDQVRNISNGSQQGSMFGGSPINSPISPHFAHGAQFEKPHGAENLVPRSGSQADLRKAMENANL